MELKTRDEERAYVKLWADRREAVSVALGAFMATAAMNPLSDRSRFITLLVIENAILELARAVVRAGFEFRDGLELLREKR